MATITSPIEGFTGVSQVADTVLDFKDGKASVESLPRPVSAFLKRRGYKVAGGGGRAATKASDDGSDKGDGGDGKGGGDVL